MKNLPALILLFCANTISGIAQGISMIAIPWYFTQQGESALFGLVYWLITFSALFWSPAAGTFVDKYNRKNIFLVVGLTSGVILTFISLSGYYQGEVPLGMAALAFALTFFNYNLHYPNLYAFLQEITEAKNYGLITSAVEIQGQVATVLSGAGAAFLLEGLPDGVIHFFGKTIQLPFNIQPWELYEIFALDAITYFVGFVLVAFIRFTPIIERVPETGKMWARLKTGFNYLRSHPYIFLFGVASYSIFVTVLLFAFYLSAVYVDNHLGRGGEVYAISEVFYAIGAIFAGIAIRKIFSKMTFVSSVILMTIVTACLYLTIAFTQLVWLFYLMLFLLGVTNAGTRIQRVTYLFTMVPNQVYGRANSIFGLTNILWRVFFLGLFAVPFFHEGNNIIFSVMTLSLFLFVTAVVMVVHYGKMVIPASKK